MHRKVDAESGDQTGDLLVDECSTPELPWTWFAGAHYASEYPLSREPPF